MVHLSTSVQVVRVDEYGRRFVALQPSEAERLRVFPDRVVRPVIRTIQDLDSARLARRPSSRVDGGTVAAGLLFAVGTKKYFDFYGYSAEGIMTIQPHKSLMGFAAFGIASLAFLWFQNKFYKPRDSGTRKREVKERIVHFINDE
eukprot:jgi/Mesvir1/22055/Mv12710-RA.1